MRAQSDFSDLGDEATGLSAAGTSGRQDSSPPDFTLEPAGSAAQRDKLNEIVAGGRQRLGDRAGTEFNFFLEKAGMPPPSGGASWLGLDGVLRPPTREFANPGAAQPAGNLGIAPADDPTSLTSVASAMAGPTSFLLPTLPAAIARSADNPVSHYVGEELGGAVAGAWDKLKSDGRNWWAVHTGQRPSYAPPDGAGLVSQARYGVRRATDEANVFGIPRKLGEDVVELATAPLGAAIHGAVTRPLATALSYIPLQAYGPQGVVLDDDGVHFTPSRRLTRAETEQMWEGQINLGLATLGPEAESAEASALGRPWRRPETVDRDYSPPPPPPDTPPPHSPEMHDLGDLVTDEPPSTTFWPDGSFSIHSFDGLHPDVFRPVGPFRVLEDDEYALANRRANAALRAYRKAQGLVGRRDLHVHHVHPVKFGGHPTDPANFQVLDRSAHIEASRWWQQIQRHVEANQ